MRQEECSLCWTGDQINMCERHTKEMEGKLKKKGYVSQTVRSDYIVLSSVLSFNLRVGSSLSGYRPHVKATSPSWPLLRN